MVQDNVEVRDELVIAQLDVLTNLWRNLPRIVKEDMPETIRALFRPDIELELMQDAAPKCRFKGSLRRKMYLGTFLRLKKG